MTAVHTEDLDLLERLGGSRATVHRAMVRTTGRVVVAKQAPWDRPDVAAGLGREAAVLDRVQHVAVVRLLHTVDDDHGRTLVLTHAPGGSLAERVDRHGPLPPAEVADIGSRLAEGLAALHREGVVHRDVHPGNVVVDAELQPVLIDLDHALDAAGEHLPADDEVVGHPDHVDPRLFSGHPPGPAADMHGLATTLWTAATGSPPPRNAPQDPVQLPHDGRVPPPLHDALRACLETDDAAAIAMTLRTVSLELAAPQEPRRREEAAADGPLPVAAGVAGTGGPRTGGPTRRWGTAPRPAALTAFAPASGRRWLALAVAAAVVALAPLALWLVRDDRAGTATPEAVTAPPPCDGVEPSPTDVLADLDADGCSEAIALDDGVLRTPAGTYRLGQAGDVLLAGDWDGDGTWTPGLYRPATGAAFLFDTVPGITAVTSRPSLQLSPGGSPRVTDADGDGAHELVAIAPDA